MLVNESKIKLWIVTPTFHDFKSFISLYKNTHTLFKQNPKLLSDIEISWVVIDDSAGRDEFLNKTPLSDLENVHVLFPPFNLGHQSAIVYALRNLQHKINEQDLIITMDSDGEDLPNDIPKLIGPFIVKNIHCSNVVLAIRTKRKENLIFKLLYFFFKLLFKITTGRIINNGNFICFKGAFLIRMIDHPSFDLCYSSTFISLNVPYIGVPCERAVRYYGKSRMNTFHLIMHGLRMLLPFASIISTRGLILLFIIFLSLLFVCLPLELFMLPFAHTICIAHFVMIMMITLSSTLFLLFYNFHLSNVRSIRF
ncbi:MAG: glycosyltransferase [Oligoflexia bacterium]|nr:glycosyltransferase [Oligoflexia bacterium]